MSIKYKEKVKKYTKNFSEAQLIAIAKVPKIYYLKDIAADNSSYTNSIFCVFHNPKELSNL